MRVTSPHSLRENHMFAEIVRKVRDAAAAFGRVAQGNLTPTDAVMWQHKMMQLADHMDKPAVKRESPHFPGNAEYEVYDWSKAEIGTIVTRSDHWMEQHKTVGNNLKKKWPMYGIVTSLSFFQDGKGRLVTWPSIHWEKESYGSMNHPLNVKPLRSIDEKILPKMTMDDGQWGTERLSENW